MNTDSLDIVCLQKKTRVLVQVFKQGASKPHGNYSDARYLAEIEILDDSPQLNYGRKLQVLVSIIPVNYLTLSILNLVLFRIHTLYINQRNFMTTVTISRCFTEWQHYCTAEKILRSRDSCKIKNGGSNSRTSQFLL